jgi:signal transduction histidine kinase
VKASAEHRRHALRVAGAATLIVMIAYVIAALVLNLIVTNHLLSRADQRISDRLHDTVRQTLTLPGSDAPAERSTDVDDSPVFVWSVDHAGLVTALTPGAPSLPARPWTGGPVSLGVGGSTFRFDSIHSDAAVLVGGESIAGTANVQSILFVAELVFGVLLAVAVFAGATVVGLRASAPSELVRRRQAEFTADASHELRTPVSVIEAEVGLALDRPRSPQAYREVLERVRLEGTRLRKIVDDLLWLARADDQPMHADGHEIVDLADVARNSVQRFGALAATNAVQLSWSCDGEGPFVVQAPSDLIDRLAGVLVDNACKFAGSGGRVEVSARAVGSRVVLRVDDSGPGIPVEQRDAVFDRFHRGEDGVSGTGLGLAIADSVVRGTNGAWSIGVAALGGARMEVSWRRAAPRRGRGREEPASLHEFLS